MNLPDRRWRADDAEIDEIIRQALREEVSPCEPPPEVWQRISSQIAAGPAPHRRPPVRSLSQFFAPLMQGLAATAVLLLLGLSLGPNLLWQSYQFGATGQLVDATPMSDDSAAVEVEPAIEPAIVLDAGSADMLSVGALRRYEAETAQNAAPVLLQPADPELDPILVNRHLQGSKP
jgi:hypothetical protein